MGEATTNILEVTDLSFAYKDKKILDNISFSVQPNQFIAVLGINGAGKSTLIKCLNKIINIDSGSVKICNKPLTDTSILELSKLISYVPQSVSTGFSMDVYDVILLGRRPYINWRIGRSDRDVVQNVITRLGLDDFIFRKFHTLSGGEQQRVIIAKAIVQDPVLYLFDEPTSNLDLSSQFEILYEIKNLVCNKGKKCSALVAMHDINLAAKFADKIIIIDENTIYCYDTPYAALSRETISKVYGVVVDVLFPDNPQIPQINVIKPNRTNKNE
jgi:iron complex transport system ATP-binding protein